MFRKRSLAQTIREAACGSVDKMIHGNDIRTQLYQILGERVTQTDDYITALEWLRDGEFMQRCEEIVTDYHAGDDRLVAKLLRGALRPVYSSRAALLHFAFTGASGSGKSDLVATVLSLLPQERVVAYTSITPKDLYYALNDAENPDMFRNKIIAITEINDTKKWDAIKAFAELDEYRSESHATTIGMKQRVLTINGPRALWITSVKTVGDEQVRRRFINSTIDSESVECGRKKAKIITKNILNQTSIENDWRLPIARAGFNLLYASQPEFASIDTEAADLVYDVNMALVERHYSPTHIKQLYSMAECGAVEKQFARGICQVWTEDILEAWFLLGFEDDSEVQINGKWVEPLDPLRQVQRVDGEIPPEPKMRIPIEGEAR